MDKKKKRVVNEKKATLSNTEILLHPRFKNLINSENKQIFKSWMIAPKLLELTAISSPHLAWTDNRTLTINVNSEIFKGASREEALLYVYGMSFHEIGHVLFTSYTSMKTYREAMIKGRLWPNNPSTEYDEYLEEFLKYISNPIKANNMYALIGALANMFEDPRIEYLLNAYCTNCDKHKDGLELVQDYLYKTTMKPISELREDENHCDATILNQIMFNYARFGEVVAGDEKDEIYKYLLEVMEYIEQAVYAEKSAEFYNCINNIIITCWPVYKKFLDDVSGETDDEENEESSDGFGESSGDSEKTEDDTDDSDGSGEGSESDDASDVSGKIKAILEDMLEGMSPTHENEEEFGESEGSDSSSITSEMEKRNPDFKDDFRSRGGRNSEEHEYEDDPGVKINFDALVNNIAEEKADEEINEETTRALSEMAKDMDYSDFNKSVSIEFRRPIVTPEMRQEYRDEVIQTLVRIGKETAKKMLKAIPQESDPITIKNRVVGSRFDASSVARNDLRYFSKKSSPEEGLSLAIGLVVDESGSMCNYGRDTTAKAAAIALYACAETLGVPVCVYGHTADESRYDVNLIDYADFDKPDSNDKYRLMNIKARSNNRDAVPLQFVAERLLTTNCEKKLLIVISDGQPAACGYGGTPAIEDMKRVVKKYSKMGVSIVAAAIGSDKDNIKTIYSAERFLDVTDLSELPRELLKVVKRNLR